MTAWHKSLLYFALALAMFSLFRLVFYLSYRSYFSRLSAGQTFQAFAHGVRFDAAIIAMFFVVPILLINLPLTVFASEWWQQPLAWILWTMTALMAMVLAADIVYFGFVERHIGSELAEIEGDLGAMLRLAFTSYWAVLIAYVVLCAGLAVLWWHIAARPTLPPRPGVLGAVEGVMVFVALLFALVITGRGWTFYGKAISVVHAFTSGNTAAGNLTINGLFSGVMASHNSRGVNHLFFDSLEARRIVAESYPPTAGEFPFSRRFAPKQTRPNVVFVLLESWSFHYVDGFAGGHYGATSNFDALARQSLRFTQAYSHGQRTMEGIQATLTGIPKLMGRPHIGKGLEASNISRLGAIAQRHGYQTIFAQSSRRGSLRMDAIAQAAGFKEYYGMEDYPILLDYPNASASAFGWDYETFMFLNGKLAHRREPFLAYVFTGTTHEPFARLPPRFERHTPGTLSEDGFLNTLYYADWSLGEFMKSVRESAWYKDTVFVLVADHPVGKLGIKEIPDRFHIPLLIHAPGLIEAAANDVVASQLDLFPTLMDLMGFDDPFSALGESLLRKQDGHAFVVSGRNIVGLIGKEGYLTSTLKTRLDTGPIDNGPMPPPAYFDDLEKKLLATDQVVFELLQSNRWAPP
ncbi:MAG: LTA synthase family protein [Sulfuricaulis sp.]